MKDNKKNETPLGTPLSEEELNLVRESIASQKVDRSRLPHYDNSLRARLWRYVKRNKSFATVCAVLAICMITVLSLCIVFAVNKISESNRMVGTKESSFTVIFFMFMEVLLLFLNR